MKKEKIKTLEIVVFTLLQYIFLPVLCGFLTAGILAIAGMEKLGLDRLGFTNFPTITVQTTTWSNYSGLMLSAGLGCVLGFIISRMLKFGAKLGHFDFISPPKSVDAMPVPSVAVFVKSIIRLAGIPLIVVAGAMTSLKLAATGMIPGVNLDVKMELFEVTMTGVVTVAAIGCLLMFVYDMILSILLKMTNRKEVEIKELK